MTGHGGLRVLVAEANPVHRALAAALAERAGCRADVVAGAAEAAEAMALLDYDVALLDDGFSPADRPRARVAVALVSPGASEAPRWADRVLTRPLRLEELRALLDSVSARGPDAPALDPEPLRRLSETLGAGGPALVAELLTVFASDAPRTLGELRTALAAGDASTARRAAHSLKSNAATLGAVRLAAACRELEDRAAAGDLAAGLAGLPAVERELAGASEALRRLDPGSSIPSSAALRRGG